MTDSLWPADGCRATSAASLSARMRRHHLQMWPAGTLMRLPPIVMASTIFCPGSHKPALARLSLHTLQSKSDHVRRNGQAAWAIVYARLLGRNQTAAEWYSRGSFNGRPGVKTREWIRGGASDVRWTHNGRLSVVCRTSPPSQMGATQEAVWWEGGGPEEGQTTTLWFNDVVGTHARDCRSVYRNAGSTTGWERMLEAAALSKDT